MQIGLNPVAHLLEDGSRTMIISGAADSNCTSVPGETNWQCFYGRSEKKRDRKRVIGRNRSEGVLERFFRSDNPLRN